MTLRSDFKISAEPLAPVADEQSATETASEELRTDRVFSLRPTAAALDSGLGETVGRGETIPHAAKPRRVAVLVTHGMGQQVPFETLSAIGQALITQHTKGETDKANTPPVNVRRVTLTRQQDAPELSRAEVRLISNGRPVDVHIYESYWAPLTEGQITFLETVAFLYSAAWNGIKTCLSRGYVARRGKYFDRWLFEGFHEMEITRWTLLLLIATVLSITLLLIPAFLFFTPIGLDVCKKIYETYKNHFLSWNPWLAAIAILAVLVVWIIAYWTHYFIVEYAGDVAIYVSSYKVSRFDKIRNEILTTACTVSREIYSAGIVDRHQLKYDSVVIVGHSLGSVISYDLLNATINWDEAEGNLQYQVVSRTARLITFGSPLDKTAFLFRTQVANARNLREALAARQQPLILDYARYRPATFRWINIYSPRDIISGSLDYYDLPVDPENPDPDRNPVVNLIDPMATMPLLAHNQYWNNELLHLKLYEAVLAPVPAP